MKSNTQIQLLADDNVENFIGLINGAADSLLKAGQMLARLVANDPDIITQIKERAKNIPPSFLTKLLMVGEGSLHPALVMNGCAAYRQIAKLPYSQQERIIKANAVELVVDAQSGDAIKVPVIELDPSQVKQVISEEGLRSRDAQQAYRRKLGFANASKEAVKKIDTPAYRITSKGIDIFRPCHFSNTDLIRLIGEIENHRKSA